MTDRPLLRVTAAVLAVLACGACSGDDEQSSPGPGPAPATTGPSTGKDQAPATTAAPAPGRLSLDATVEPDGTIVVDGDQASFLMPSTNLVCLLREDGVVCQIHEKHFTPRESDLTQERSADCTAERADGLALTDGGPARWTCLPEDLRGWASVDTGGGWVGEGRGTTQELAGVSSAVLPYGATLRLGDVSCASREDGVECTARSTGRSLFLARERYGTG